MIGQAVRHGRSAKDAENLHAHLMNDRRVRVEIINSAAPNLQSAMDDMLLACDASKADAAFLHLSLSPSRDMTDGELRQVAQIVMKHFSAEEHPAAFVLHDKKRSNDRGNTHGHLVLGRIGFDGQVIPSGFEKIKLETAMRIAEFEMGETATLGRHHKSAVKWLRANGREDVAQWLDTAHHPNLEKPQSPVSPAKRQMIQRKISTDLAIVTRTVRSAWERSDDVQSFTAALSESDFDVAPGEKAGVYVVLKDGIVLGSLDRLLKIKRREVSDRMTEASDMKGKNHEPKPATKTRITSNDGAGKSNLRSSRGASSSAGPVERARASGRRTNRSATAITGVGTGGAAPSSYDDGRSAKGRQRIKAQQALTSLDQSRLTNSTVFAAQSVRTHKLLTIRHQINDAIRKIEAHKSGWSWIEEFRNDLLEKIRETRQYLFGVDVQLSPRTASKPLKRIDVSHSDVWNEVPDPTYQPMRFG
ncbi:relaxase/mobilization nuclease domain-containing protein [Ochrobactrum sp. RH2CCR150]|uniref:relaxase/mobilization nuclease domain-containing protein n=1 Tax=Ochrobactrum sp. RH2CCR150 TaxID=2587044 RepID=UPI0015F8961C|nr:hypothetical protein [Ochrobactrum sp. RH2CCR150]